MTPDEAAVRLRQLLNDGALDLPVPGHGRTVERLTALHDLAAGEDLSVARLAEAHCDAAAIVAEAGRSLPPGALAAVWASRYGGGAVTASPVEGAWRVTGELAFCSGSSIVDVALVDVVLLGGARRLLLVPLRTGGVDVDADAWSSPALAATATGRVRLDLLVDDGGAIGGEGFYLDRPGFWFGGIGVAACWAGGARGVTRATAARVDGANPHAVADLGRAEAACHGMEAVLARAGADIDERPTIVDVRYALVVRHLVAAGCREVLAASTRATGPGPLAFDAEHGRRVDDLRLYIEQHHHEADLEEVGRGLLTSGPSG